MGQAARGSSDVHLPSTAANVSCHPHVTIMFCIVDDNDVRDMNAKIWHLAFDIFLNDSQFTNSNNVLNYMLGSTTRTIMRMYAKTLLCAKVKLLSKYIFIKPALNAPVGWEFVLSSAPT